MNTLEELKTYCGLLMLDLRGNWAFDYSKRINELNDVLNLIIVHKDSLEEDIKEAKEDLEIGIDELENGDFDGRVYRSANLYGYKSDIGFTKEVYDYLKIDMSYPEYCLPDYEENELEL